MKSFYRLWIDKNLFFWLLFLIGIAIVILFFMSCAVSEPYPYKSIKRTHVKQDCKPFRNWGLPDDEFIEWVHKQIKDTNYKRIQYCRGKTLDGKTIIKMVVVYYE